MGFTNANCERIMEIEMKWIVLMVTIGASIAFLAALLVDKLPERWLNKAGRWLRFW